ncbi:MAG: hypothetical protein FJ279_04030 [Planctomycetes bacterium]|nr:hypothetical protein [Planctomycetota bacterium]
MFPKLCCTALAVLWTGLVALGMAAAEMALDEALQQLPKYEHGQPRDCLNAIEAEIVAARGSPERRRALETRLAAVVAGEATRAAKEFACRKLNVIGSAACVPAVARLLADKDLSHIARYALERLPDPAATTAMRQAMQSASGPVKVGLIHSLGVRADREAVPALVPLLESSDAEVGGAAATALGDIGTAEAAKALLAFKSRSPEKLGSVVSHACLKAAVAVARAGQRDIAEKAYESLYMPREPAAIRLAAFQGLVTVRGTASVPMLTEALASPDDQLRGVAARLVREVVSPEVVRTLASNLSKLPPAGQIAVLEAIGARQDKAARQAVLDALGSGDPNVRGAAFDALTTIGNAADVPMLAKKAAAGQEPDAGAARRTLSRMLGEDIDRAIAMAVETAETPVRVELLRSLASRVARESLPTLLAAAGHAEETVRRAALESLGALGDEPEVPALVKATKAAKSEGERQAAKKALSAVCFRSGEKSAPALIAGLEGSDEATRGILLAALGQAGGAAALGTVRKEVREAEGELKTTAIRALSEWRDGAACPDLLDIATKADSVQHHVLALRGYIRLIGQPKGKEDAKLGALKSTLGLARRPDEKKQALGEIGKLPSLPALDLAAACLAEEAIRDEAAAAVVSIADRLKVKDAEARRVSDTLDKVLQVATSDTTRKDAAKVREKYKK